MMRLAILATPAYLPDLRPAPGALDGDVIRSRLPLPDTDFRVVDLDPGVDLAEQLEGFFEQNLLDPGTPLLFYASATVALSDDGELFLCLDATNPDTGDSLRDIALVFQDRAPGPVAFVIECRHRPNPEDPFLSASVVAAGKESVSAADGRSGRIELIIAARPLSDEPDELPSPFTRTLIEALDEADPAIGLTLARFFEETRESERLMGVVPCFAHVRGKKKFFLLPLADGETPADSSQGSIPAPPITVEGGAIAPLEGEDPDEEAAHGDDAEGAAEEGAYDDGSSEAEASDEGAYDDGSSEEGASDEGAYDDGSSEEEASQEGAYDEGAYDDGSSEEEASEEGASDEEASDEEASDDGVDVAFPGDGESEESEEAAASGSSEDEDADAGSQEEADEPEAAAPPVAAPAPMPAARASEVPAARTSDLPKVVALRPSSPPSVDESSLPKVMLRPSAAPAVDESSLPKVMLRPSAAPAVDESSLPKIIIAARPAPAPKADPAPAPNRESPLPAAARKADSVPAPAPKADSVPPAAARKAESVTPPAAKADSVAPPAKKADLVAPPAQRADSVPPARKADSVAPPAAKADSVAPPAKADSVAPPAKADSVAPPPPKEATVPPPAPKAESVPPPPAGPADHVAAGDALLAAKDAEGAMTAFKRALAMLSPKDATDRGEIYVRMGKVKELQDKRREAIASYEKALQLIPGHPSTLERLVELNVVEGDHRAIQVAEDRVLATIDADAPRFAKLLEYGARWDWMAGDLKDGTAETRAFLRDRSKSIYERARGINADDLVVLGKLRAIYEESSATDDAFAIRRRIAELTPVPRQKAEQYSALAKHALNDLKREELALELFDLALDSDPTLLEPLTAVARFYAERQEWSELERAYRKMLDRAQRIQRASVRSEVTWEICQRLGLLFRDHLDEPSLALDAFEDAMAEKKTDLQGRLTAADLARSIGKFDRAVVHLQAAAALDPTRAATFHDLFDAFQKIRRPDSAYAAAQVTMYLGKAETRERFIYEEHRPEGGVLKLTRALRAEAWDLLKVRDRGRHVEAILDASARAAIAGRIAQMADEGRLPALDPAARQDPQKSTVSIVRSIAWASHFLRVPAPAIYLHDDASVGLAAVIAEEEATVAGGRALRGRSLSELAFMAARHLAYHVGTHRLLLYYPSIEELSACFLSAVKIALPELPIPANIRALAGDLRERMEADLTDEEREALTAAVEAFKSAGGRADITAWVAGVERCATRAGFLLCGGLDVAANILRDDPGGVVSAEDKIADLIAFAVSDEHAALREELAIAVQP